ncbi:SMP-30/gluconolactonase/LRE family protein [Rhodococcoides corynebacterioides]|uniref:SMP-30/gluconolactonase/LRE family protein n=1 Tax=Rhodococcoides corynebacterioides TaxID=53972 RepID=UPI003AE360C8
MSRMRTPVAASVGVLALVLSGCSSSQDGEPTAEPSASAAATSSSAGSSAATSQPSGSAFVYRLPGTGVFPEGITADDDTFWVTSTSDGAVFRGTVGDPEVRPFLAPGENGRTGAAGLDVEDGDDSETGVLVIAGGATGRVWVHDAETGELRATLTNGLGADATFLNDVVVGDDGEAYVTDSRSPVLWRVPPNAQGDGQLEPAVTFDGTPFVYGEGFNANGIVEVDDDALVIVQSSTGNLYRVDGGSREVTQVDLGGATLQNGDGLEYDDDTLYVVRNRDGLIARVDLSDDGRSGRVTGEIRDPSFAYPTTVAAADDRLLVVNSQFDKRGGDPVEPFTVSAVPR